jgi:hypothetical protein
LAEKDNMADAPVEIAAHHCATALLSPGLTERFKAGEIFRALVSMPDHVGVRATWVLLGASLKLQRSNPATLLTPIPLPQSLDVVGTDRAVEPFQRE